MISRIVQDKKSAIIKGSISHNLPDLSHII